MTNEKLDICNKALLRAAGIENPQPEYEQPETEQPVGFSPVFDEKAYALAVHLKGFEAHIAGKENAKQFRDEMRMLLDMIKQPPYLSAPKRESGTQDD
jgi:hypothetical protein